ncbi:MAG: aldose epimerase [Anaerolineae bacterium]
MAINVHILQNDYWQVGILPETGASIAFGRVKRSGEWVDVMRPTPESDYGNSSNCSSFIMLPWCNRIKDGLLRFDGQTYQLETTKDDGTARHGDVRKRAWAVDEADERHIRMSLRSTDFSDMNWPFKFAAVAEYRLEGQDFIWELALKNEDSQSFPAGFGHHPYFVKPEGINAPQVEVPCSRYFELTNYMATGAALPIRHDLDFRRQRGLGSQEINDVLTGRTADAPASIRYPQWGITLEMHSDPLFEQILLFAPAGKPYFAVEPMTNASDGFNLFAGGIAGSGVFVLQSGAERRGTVRLVVSN